MTVILGSNPSWLIIFPRLDKRQPFHVEAAKLGQRDWVRAALTELGRVVAGAEACDRPRRLLWDRYNTHRINLLTLQSVPCIVTDMWVLTSDWEDSGTRWDRQVDKICRCKTKRTCVMEWVANKRCSFIYNHFQIMTIRIPCPKPL